MSSEASSTIIYSKRTPNMPISGLEDCPSSGTCPSLFWVPDYLSMPNFFEYPPHSQIPQSAVEPGTQSLMLRGTNIEGRSIWSSGLGEGNGTGDCGAASPWVKCECIAAYKNGRGTSEKLMIPSSIVHTWYARRSSHLFRSSSTQA